MTQKIRKVVFPVGGLGTRFLPATKSMPKEMMPVVDKPLIHYAYEEAQAAGIEQFIFITGRNKNAINNHFDHAYELQKVLDEKNKNEQLQRAKDWLPSDPGSIMFIRQQQPMGLGHAIWCARHAVGDEPFAVILADDLFLSDVPCLKQMTDAYAHYEGCNMISVEEIPRDRTDKYGIFDVSYDDGKICKAKSLVEKPNPKDAPSNIAIAGRYILQPGIFKYLEKMQIGSGNEVQITDAISDMLIETELIGFRFEGTRFDCGERVGFVEANLAFALNTPDMKERMKEVIRRYI
jgi:UTP--glucose-1-phosphate uridylyltransferase